jgi:hypothetical protein
MIWCSEASCHSSGCESRQQSSDGKGNRSVGSLEVKPPVAERIGLIRTGGASNLAGRSKCVNREAPKYVPRVKRIEGGSGVPSCSDLGEGPVGIEVLA